jgi:hypothetical protein
MTSIVEGTEEPNRFDDSEFFSELRLLELHSETFTQLDAIFRPSMAENDDIARVWSEQPFTDLDCSGFAGAVRPEESKTFASTNLEIEIVDGYDRTVRLAQRAN